MPDAGNPLDELEQRRSAKRKRQDADGSPKPRAELHGRYVYLIGQDRVFDTLTSTMATKDAISTALRPELGRSAFNVLIEAGAAEIVQGPTWEPNGARFIERGALRLLNVYQPPSESPAAGGVDQYIALAEFLIPDDDVREQVFDWMAFIVQCPEQKPNWQLLLGGLEGIGKDALFFPLKRALGLHNVCTIGPHDLDSQFNEQFALKKLGILNEMMSFRDKRTENQLKPLCASPPEELSINPKGMARYSVPNLIALIAMTNHRSGFTVSRNDRRWFPYWSPAKPADSAFYRNLWQYLEGDGSLAVWHWLLQRDLSDFDAKGRSPDTAYKAELIEVSEDPTLAKLREVFEEQEPPFEENMVSTARVLAFLDDVKMDSGKLGGYLRELGCEKHRVQKKGEGSRRFWIVRKHEEIKAKTPAELWNAANALKVTL